MRADADIEVAIGCNQHAIDAAWNKALARHLVGELYAGPTVGAAARTQAINGAEYFFLFVTRRRL